MRLYLIAGEASGDLHASNLVAALRQQVPDLQVRGIGGDLLQAQGMHLLQHYRLANYMGFTDVVRHLPTILALFRRVKQDIVQWQPQAAVLVDYPGFNLRMARFLHDLGIPVIYYIAPQLWAWKKGRIRQLKRYVTRLLVILPFEQDFFRKEGLEVDFVGHPLLDALEGYRAVHPTPQPLSPKPIIALLPGSRPHEISRLLPVMLQAAAPLADKYHLCVAAAPSLTPEVYAPLLQGSPARLVEGQTYELLRQAHTALVTSGTATLETALWGVPEAVVYRTGWLTYRLARAVIRVPFISLVNLILGRLVVRELIQHQANATDMAQELHRLATDPALRARMAADYTELRQRLGGPGASQRAAALILDILRPEG